MKRATRSIESGMTLENMLNEKKLTIFRPVYTQNEFDLNHGGKYVEIPIKDKIGQMLRSFKDRYSGKVGAKRLFGEKFPFVSIMSKYKWKSWFPLDLIAGLIVGTMQIPQSLAYAHLAGLQPIYGMYLAFFPVFIYYFLGTSKHISIGTDAIISLLSGSFLQQSLIDYPFPAFIPTANETFSAANEAGKASRIAGFTLCVGISHIIMGLMNFAFLIKYLSEPMISGFTVGSAIIVFSTQLKHCFGVKIPRHDGIFSVFRDIYDVCKQLPNTNLPTFGMAAISIVILGIVKNVVNPLLVEKIHIPIPIELVLVIFGTLSSTYLNLNTKYNVTIVGPIIRGLPAPSLPNLTHLSDYISNILITAVIVFSVSISLGKVFAKKHGYEVDASQELYAYGFMNVFSSFFSCYPSGASVSRSAVQEAAGCKSQITSLISAVVILFVLLFIGPLFENLPNCILASIIIVALKGLLMKFVELKELWKISIWDLFIWIVTFICTVFEVEFGLVAGIALSIVSNVIRTQSPKSFILGQIIRTDLYKKIEEYEHCYEIPGIKIFRYEGSVYYASRTHFKKSLYTKVFINPEEIKLRKTKLKRKIKKRDKLSRGSEEDGDTIQQPIYQEELDGLTNLDIHHIIIDCSTWGYVDFVGVKTLNHIIKEYSDINVTVLLANVKTDVRKMFIRMGSPYLTNDGLIYISIHDAVTNCLYSQEKHEVYL